MLLAEKHFYNTHLSQWFSKFLEPESLSITVYLVDPYINKNDILWTPYK